jgi:2-C-methyl-D-erythritol 4-phosphate cytidylyltransferase
MNPVSDTVLILAAGGASTRFDGGSKLFAELDGIPVFLHAVRTAASVLAPGSIILSVPAASETEFRTAAETHLPGVPLHFAHGGATRTLSVLNALEAADALGESRFRLAAVHDAGRPMLTPELLLACLDAARIHGGAMACRKVTETVKRITPDGFLGGTVPRDGLRTAETPQVFQFAALLGAYRLAAASGETFTDDAQVMERFAPVRVFPVEHDFPNPKITYRPDLELCRTLLRLRCEESGT